jgi:hypothetical protein
MLPVGGAVIGGVGLGSLTSISGWIAKLEHPEYVGLLPLWYLVVVFTVFGAVSGGLAGGLSWFAYSVASEVTKRIWLRLLAVGVVAAVTSALTYLVFAGGFSTSTPLGLLLTSVIPAVGFVAAAALLEMRGRARAGAT